MPSELPTTRQAVVLDQFGSADELDLRDLPVPPVEAGEVLLALDAAGVGSWDPFEREGGYTEATGGTPQFPYVLGSEGAGEVVAVGGGVSGPVPGDRVYAASFLNPKGGFYTDHVVVPADLIRPAPRGMTVEQAAAFSGVACTALRGLDDVLGVQRGESVAVVGASGGIGHTAVQLARSMGARVLAVASGPDGVALAEDLGADAAVDGRAAVDEVDAAVEAFAPGGLDAVLCTTGGDVADAVVGRLDDGGRAAHPTGVFPEPAPSHDATSVVYNGEPDADLLSRLDRLVADGPFTVHIGRTYPLSDAAQAHAALDDHVLGKIVLTIG